MFNLNAKVQCKYLAHALGILGQCKLLELNVNFSSLSGFA